MFDGVRERLGLPIAAAPVAAGSEVLYGEVSETVRCLLVGAELGQQAVMLAESLVGYSTPHTDPETADLVRKAWLNGVVQHRQRLAKLVPEAVRCGAEPGGKLVTAWYGADAALRDLINTPSDQAIAHATEKLGIMIHTVQKATNDAGIDPPLLRNLRRVQNIRGARETKP